MDTVRVVLADENLLGSAEMSILPPDVMDIISCTSMLIGVSALSDAAEALLLLMAMLPEIKKPALRNASPEKQPKTKAL